MAQNRQYQWTSLTDPSHHLAQRAEEGNQPVFNAYETDKHRRRRPDAGES